ncbi:DNA repair protein [Yoonia sp. BS5-3]|uniref:DNA repair protein n=1 Tax=Yoonia phaeophyticola TaxID=3137369 RepID=A0ABZ2VAE5_9RHOB
MLAARLRSVSSVVNMALLILVGCMAAAAVIYTVICLLGLAPWLEFTAVFGDTVLPQAGQFLQIVGTLILILFASFLPSSAKINQLQNSHRAFHLKMDDVTRAYHAAHAADRSGMFTLKSEFDAVRERLAFLRDHPELGNLETDIMEIAAQMSQQSRDLAQIYSDEKVDRARMFLRQRQQEAEQQKARIEQALQDCREIEKWAAEVDMEESIVASRLSQLEARVAEVMPTPNAPFGGANVYPMPHGIPAE